MLVALARAKPGQLAYGTPGQGTTQHVFGEMLKQAAKIDVAHAPFQGGGPAATAVMGGHVPLVVGNVTELDWAGLVAPAPTTPEQFGEVLRSETARYGATIKEAGMKLE